MDLKHRPHITIILVAFAFALGLGAPMLAQLAQSGGAGNVTLQAGSALAGKFGIDQTTPGTTNAVSLSHLAGTAVASGNGVVSAGVQRVAIASDNTAFAVNAVQSGTWTVQPGNTANTTAWFVKAVPATTCGTTAVSQAIAAVPTSSTAVFAATTCLISAVFNNTNASAQTVTLTDNAGSPVTAIGATFSIPGLSFLVIPFNGIPFTTGVKWLAGGTGVTGGMAGFQ